MSAPTPAAVRFVLQPDKSTREERQAFFNDERWAEEILTAHIRAIAAEMRALAGKHEEDGWYTSAQSLKTFADKLEGRES